MREFDPAEIRVVACDIFGTTVDWRTGVADQVARIAADHGLSLDGGAFADAWRDRYLPSLRRVNRGERDWAPLDTLHRESLDELLDERGAGSAFDDAARRRLVHAWHRLPAWADAVAGLARLRRRFVVTTLSNGGFALLTTLVKAAGLPFDCIVSAELARAYKPAPRAYLTAAELLDVEPGQVLLVAAHRWDIDGARDAGLATAFLERPLEKGPGRTADRAADVAADLSVTGFDHLAGVLGC
ncbi:haloacid dehalogenase type II [Nonomuraea rhodomycinica]|uniref:Haloacid dehalogenase type II n=1 Tax=Nonomuraea rhodomycinica TaxID=1712872 RepID=A0A7Y6MCN9_9ACTN|nr:haloacid dehalogenase type II [Nonomuraea rhodomycinica]NUW41956.1 haloacid dehalogenase type II [Nonomuraea rhodomycinica]